MNKHQAVRLVTLTNLWWVYTQPHKRLSSQHSCNQDCSHPSSIF